MDATLISFFSSNTKILLKCCDANDGGFFNPGFCINIIKGYSEIRNEKNNFPYFCSHIPIS
jgi:hypothetical protein